MKKSSLRLIAPSLIAVLVIVLVAIAAPLLAPQDPVMMDMAGRLKGPSAGHLLGQDEFGRDVLSRLIYGAQVTLIVSLSAAAGAAFLGTLAGLVGGYFRGAAEFFTLRIADIMLSFPPILLALLVVTLSGPGIAMLIGVLAVLYMPEFARIVFGEVRALRDLEYVEAMRALGATGPRILGRTILPNIAGPILVQFSMTVSAAIVVEAGLSFLGLGAVPPTPSWGLMIRSARFYMDTEPLGLVWPCVALAVTIFSVNALCDALRDVLDPRMLTAPKRKASRTAATASVGDLASAANRQTGAEQAQLIVSGLKVNFATAGGSVPAVRGVDFSIMPGETLAVVGETGSGKSVSGLSIMGLLPAIAEVAEGSIVLQRGNRESVDLLNLDKAGMRAIRGNDIGMIFQEPMTSLNPVYRVGDQIVEAIMTHQKCGKKEAAVLALEKLRKVGMNDPERRFRQFPHELSGGMRQRALIALALCCNPLLLIADEPTTALDVTIQAEIIDLIQSLQKEELSRMSVMFVTHNLGLVAQIADRVIVMYAGQVVEQANVAEIFATPRHPYTRGLLNSIPQPRGGAQGGNRSHRLAAIPGSVPALSDGLEGCSFAARCSFVVDSCRRREPALDTVYDRHQVRCLRWKEV